MTIDFTGGHQNESMLAYLFRVLLTSFQPPGRSPEEVVRPASHAVTPGWESTEEDCYRPACTTPPLGAGRPQLASVCRRHRERTACMDRRRSVFVVVMFFFRPSS